MNGYQDLITASLNEKKGLMLFLNGQTVAGQVTALRDNGVLELRNREYSKILIRLDRIDAMAMA